MHSLHVQIYYLYVRDCAFENKWFQMHRPLFSAMHYYYALLKNQSRHNIMYDSGHVMNIIRIPNDHIL